MGIVVKRNGHRVIAVKTVCLARDCVHRNHVTVIEHQQRIDFLFQVTKVDSACGGGSAYVTLLSSSEMGQIAKDKDLTIIHRIFGANLDTAVILEADNKTDAKCQQAVAKAVFKCQDTKWKAFNSCKKNKIKGKNGPAPSSAQELQDRCLGQNGTDESIPDPKGKIAKKCDFTGTISKKCPNLDVYLGCPGVGTAQDLLGLITFFTTGPTETRAWTIRRGTKAPQAAGQIHTDFERGFIRAETIPFTAFDRYGSEAAARDAGVMRSEGKEYTVVDGDVILFRFNV